MPQLTAKEKLLLLIQQKKQQKELENANARRNARLSTNSLSDDGQVLSSPIDESSTGANVSITLSDGRKITYNEKQREAISLVLQGYSLCLSGPAGSGKTTTVRGILNALLASSRNQILERSDHKYLPTKEVPGIIGCAFTNKAVENVKKNIPTELQGNFVTIHKLLEFGPVYYTITDEATGKDKQTMRFEPSRNAGNPLPRGIYVLILEESSMIDVPLWNMLIDALPTDKFSKLQVIMIGDIQQLPPVFGKSIYIHAMQKGMRTVELTEIHRQAMESPIISLANRILSGKMITANELPEFSIDKMATGHGKVTIHPWKKTLSDIGALRIMSAWLPEAIDKKIYDPEVDIILTPFNKSFGTIEMNSIVASHLAKKLNADVWEVFTGINKCYFRLGERVLYNKSEARIIKIAVNGAYYGKRPRNPSNTMDYKGIEHDRSKLERSFDLSDEEADAAMDHIEKMLSAMSDHTNKDSPTSQAASHVITVRSEDTGSEYELRTAGEVNSLSLGYALTVHKSQGSEYRRVFFITHKSQAVAIYRELVYTGVTRAKEELYIICEPSFFVQGINTQRLPGSNVQEKIANFDRMLELENRGKRQNSDASQNPIGLERFIEIKEGVEA